MKSLVVYDSQFGNTQKIAQAVARSLSAELFSVGEISLHNLKDINLLIVGSPTQGGRATVVLQQFLDQIPAGGLAGIKVAAFDTRFDEKKVNFILKMLIKKFDYAAFKMAKILVDKGGRLITPPIGFFVTGKKGPLAPGELDRAAKWIKSE